MRLSLKGEWVVLLAVYGGLGVIAVVGEAGILPLELPRLILTSLALFLLPGYFWHLTLFPARESAKGWERAALTVGLSAASAPFLVIMLDGVLQVPLTLPYISFGVFSWTCLGAAIAGLRRHRLGPQRAFSLQIPSVSDARTTATGDRVGAILVACIVVLMVIVGLALVLTYQTPSPAQAFSEFFVLGEAGNAEAYLSHLQTGVPSELRLGLVNGEQESYEYSVTARLGDEVVGVTQSRNINPGETQQWTIAVTALQAGNAQPLTFELWRDDTAEPYRTLRLWVDVTD